jgi:transposase
MPYFAPDGLAPQATRDLRALLRHRASLVRMGTACKNRVHAVLADRGIPNHSSLWTGPGRAWLADLELPATPRGTIQDCCGLLDALATPIARLEREIYALAKPDPRVQALMTLPGVAGSSRSASQARPGPQDLVFADAAVGQHRVHPVLPGGAHADQAGPVAQQGPQVADLLGGDPGLGQQISP